MIQTRHNLTCKEVIERIKDILATDDTKAPKDIDVAKALNISPNTLSQKKFQNTIPYPQVLDFLHSKNISINQFFYGSNPQEVARSSLRYKILKIYEANVSAGGGCENENSRYSNVVFDIKILEQFLKMFHYAQHDNSICEIVCVRGDSMEYLMSDKSLCFINRKERCIKDSKIYAINTLDGLFVKQCYVKGKYIELVSFNTAYKPLTYPIHEIDIVGRVRGVMNAL